MSTPKTLLYPLSIDTSYFEGYAWAVSLAHRTGSKLHLLSTTTENPSPEAENSIYCSLLEAHGFYIEHYQPEAEKGHESKSQTHTASGDLAEALTSLQKKDASDLLILDAAFLSRYRKNLLPIIKASKGVIILSDYRCGESEDSHPDHFYNHLRQAQFHNLPDNFFNTLGRDTSGYNYLRKFFQKSQS
jgi:hypothetical protein